MILLYILTFHRDGRSVPRRPRGLISPGLKRGEDLPDIFGVSPGATAGKRYNDIAAAVSERHAFAQKAAVHSCQCGTLAQYWARKPVTAKNRGKHPVGYDFLGRVLIHVNLFKYDAAFVDYIRFVKF
jgi:hypothetical protein